jgi:hypothetical protein
LIDPLLLMAIGRASFSLPISRRLPLRELERNRFSVTG